MKRLLFRRNVTHYSVCSSIHSLTVYSLRILSVVLPLCIRLALMMYHNKPLGMIKTQGFRHGLNGYVLCLHA